MLYDHDAGEDRFLDEELEARRVALFTAVDALMGKCAKCGFPNKTLNNFYELGDAEWRRDKPPEGERYERFEARREKLNRVADELVSAYDALMSAAQPRLATAVRTVGRPSAGGRLGERACVTVKRLPRAIRGSTLDIAMNIGHNRSQRNLQPGRGCHESHDPHQPGHLRAPAGTGDALH